MKPPPFRYHDPRSVLEAVDLLDSLANSRLLAGGQSLMAMLNMRYAFPDHLIDLNCIGELAGIEQRRESIRIGAMTRQRDIQDNARIRHSLPLLVEALSYVGHRQTRNRGTIGGSLCHLDPTAELVSVANNMGAIVEIAGTQGVRELPVEQFAVGYMMTALEPNELVTAVRFPIPQNIQGFSFVELTRRHGDFAIVSVATTLEYDTLGRIARVAVTLGGMGPLPVRLVEAEEILIGSAPTAASFAEVGQAAQRLEAIEDAFVPAWYRKKVAGVMVRRGLSTAHSRSDYSGEKG